MKKVDTEITDIELFADHYMSNMQNDGRTVPEQMIVKNFVRSWLKYLERVKELGNGTKEDVLNVNM
jgi:hypothetical protein